MKYLKHRSLAVAARLGAPLRPDCQDLPAFLRIYHFHVAHPGDVVFGKGRPYGMRVFGVDRPGGVLRA